MMGAEQSELMLREALVGRIGTVGADGMPYVTPMNFVYDPENRSLHFHCGTTGHLLDNLSHSPKACFEIDEADEVIATDTTACGTSHVYRSVICFGEARVVSTEQEAQEILVLFARKYIDELMPERKYDRDMNLLHETTAITMRIDLMAGKQRPRPAGAVS